MATFYQPEHTLEWPPEYKHEACLDKKFVYRDGKAVDCICKKKN